MAWNYLSFHGVVLQCVLFRLAMEYFMETLLSVFVDIFPIFNMMFHHIYQHVSWILCNFSCRASSQIIMTEGLHLIPIDSVLLILKL